MNIIAKMYCALVEEHSNGETVVLEAVTADTEENKSFSEATPSASLRMWISNPKAVGAFQQGVEYFVRVEPAAPAVQEQDPDGNPYTHNPDNQKPVGH